MAKLDEDFFNSLEFGRIENKDDDGTTKIVFNCSYKGIYRQYTMIFHPKFHKPNELPHLEYEAKRILAWSIDAALKQMNDNS